LMNGSVTGIVMLAEALGIVTDTTVMLEDSVKFPPVGGMTTVCVTDALDVTLLDGPGRLADDGGVPVVAGIDTFADGVVCVNVPDLGVELADEVELDVTFKLLLGVTLGRMVVEIFKLTLGVTLGRTTIVEFECVTIVPLTVELD
jgi:predicted permease